MQQAMAKYIACQDVACEPFEQPDFDIDLGKAVVSKVIGYRIALFHRGDLDRYQGLEKLKVSELHELICTPLLEQPK